jgi:hypothetical protein
MGGCVVSAVRGCAYAEFLVDEGSLIGAPTYANGGATAHAMVLEARSWQAVRRIQPCECIWRVSESSAFVSLCSNVFGRYRLQVSAI